MRTPVLAAMLCLLAGCGSSAPHRAAAKDPCPAKLRAALAPSAAEKLLSHDPGLTTCRFTTPQATVDVTLDDGPQAWRRWQRAQVERTQAAVEWSHTPADRPRDVAHVGAGAFWINRTRELQASDGRRLIDVRVRAPRAITPARALATRLAPTVLGPPHVPVATGP